MFKPIIHNIQPGNPGYTECQLYNNLVANRPKGGGSLASKQARLKAWENLCNQALEEAKKAFPLTETF